MHIHILGICGTFMGGYRPLARSGASPSPAVTRTFYPPMSDQHFEQGIRAIRGLRPRPLALKPDIFVVGNVFAVNRS